MPSLLNEHQQFFDEVAGVPINNGYIYIGTLGLDPTVLANQLTIYSDAALTTAIDNPQRTGADGRAVNKIYVADGGYSIEVQDSATVQKYNNLNNGDIETTSSSVSYLPAGAGAVSTTVQSKLRETVSVNDYGALGDGVTDDLASFEAARDSGSNVIIVPEATYRISAQLTMSVDDQIWICESATIKPLDSFTDSSIVRATGSNVEIRGLTLEGNSANVSGASGLVNFNRVISCKVNDTDNYGITGNDRSSVTIKDCTVTNTNNYGIWCQNLADTATLTDINIENNTVDMSHISAATSTKLCCLVRGTSTKYTKRIKITGNTFKQVLSPTNSTPMGVECRFTENVVIANNKSNNGSMLTSVAASETVAVVGNTAESPAFYGIEIAGVSGNGCKNVTITGNSVECGGLASSGIALQGVEVSDTASISGNTVRNPDGRGIFINSKWDNIILSGNNIYMSEAASTHGIYLLGSASEVIQNVAITGNMLDGQSTALKGIYAYNVTELVINGNVFDAWTQDGINLTADTVAINYVTINGNIFTNPGNNTVVTATVSTGSFGDKIMIISSPDYRNGGVGTTMLDLSKNLQETWTTATPESAVTAGIGSTFRRTNGSKGRTLYIKESGTGNTGWAGVATSSETTGGTGSAGAGNQYIEVNIGGSTYKVLHDGTV